MRIFAPASAPAWLKDVTISIERAFRQIMPAPFRLRDYATADLPAAADFRQGIVYDSSVPTLKLSDGADWLSFSPATHVHAASAIANSPAGSLLATDVQAAIDELDNEKQPLDATLTALAGLGASAGLVEQTGADAFATRAIGTAAAMDILTRADGDGRYALAAHGHLIADVTGLQAALDLKLDDSQASAFGLTLLNDSDAATARSTLGLGTAALVDTGTSGPVVPKLDQLIQCSAGIRATGSGTVGASGGGVEMLWTGTTAVILGWDRTASAYQPLNVVGSVVNLIVNGVVIASLDGTGLNMASGKTIRVNGTQILTSRRTGWTAATGTASRATFATASVTTEQLAQRVKALIDDLTTHGLIGS